MSMPRRNPKRDTAEPEIVNALTQCGFSVYRLNTPVDLLVGFRGKTWPVEVKSGHKGYGKALNEAQQKFADEWKGTPVVVLHDAQEAIDFAVSVAAGEAA